MPTQTQSAQTMVQNIINAPAPAPGERKTWYTSTRDKLIPNGLWSSTTAISRLFDAIPTPSRIILIGLDSVGKTTLLHQHLSQNAGRDVHTHVPSIGLNIEEVRLPRATFYTYDIGGGRPRFFFQFESALFNACDAVVWVVDAMDRDRLVEAVEEMARGLGGHRGEDGIRKSVPVLVLANKQGVEGAYPPAEIENEFLGKGRTGDRGILELLSGRSWHFTGTDVLSGDGVLEAFTWLSNVMKGKPTKQEMSEKSRV